MFLFSEFTLTKNILLHTNENELHSSEKLLKNKLSLCYAFNLKMTKQKCIHEFSFQHIIQSNLKHLKRQGCFTKVIQSFDRTVCVQTTKAVSCIDASRLSI